MEPRPISDTDRSDALPLVSYHINSTGSILSATFDTRRPDEAAKIARFVEDHNKGVRCRMQIGDAK